MMTRRDWWVGVAAVVFALLVHALVPRYDIVAIQYGAGFVRIDRWSGRAELVGAANITRATWVTAP